jgi:hypothetical protein
LSLGSIWVCHRCCREARTDVEAFLNMIARMSLDGVRVVMILKKNMATLYRQDINVTSKDYIASFSIYTTFDSYRLMPRLNLIEV